MAQAAPSSGSAPYLEQFERLQGSLPGSALPWVEALRRGGIERFAALGLPTPRVEDWKYTPLRLLEKTRFLPRGLARTPANVPPLPAALYADSPGPRVVFVNGRLDAERSRLDALPDGVTLEPLAATLQRDPAAIEDALGRIAALDDQPMLALNTALMDDGFVLRLAVGSAPTAPIEVVFLGGAADQPLAYHPRNLIILEAGSRATVVEHHAGAGDSDYFSNVATEIRLGADAALRHYKVQDEAARGIHLATLHAEVARGAVYESFALATGALLSRQESRVRLDGEGAHCRLGGAYLMRGRQHCDNTTVIEHRKPRTSCREVFKGVLDDDSHGVFQGRLVVHRGAQQTDGHQLSKALLLSDRAEIDAKPELKIFADDVKCSHGATAGEIDHDALFYLRSRGVPEARARGLLIQSFLVEALEEVGDERLRAVMLARVEAWLADAGGSLA